MEPVSFKKRVAEVAIEQAKQYEDVFINYEYLICSEAFVKQDYYIIAATSSNYRHLIGVSTSISAVDFFEKCMDGSLSENDFDFTKPGKSEREVKGSVRRKIKSLPFLMSIMREDLVVQEDYIKNGVICSFASTDCNVTVGFVNEGKSRPKSLLWGDSLDWNKAAYVELILRKKRNDNLFSEIIIGDGNMLLKYKDRIDAIVDPELFVNLTVVV